MRIFKSIFSPKPSAAPVKRLSKRGYDAAKVSRLTANWATHSYAVDQDIYRSLNILVSRSRDLGYNNDYAKKFLQMTCTHIVGPVGFTISVNCRDKSGALNTSVNTALEKAFLEWGRRGVCDVTGKLSFVDIQHLAVRSIARDGEVLIRKVYGSSVNRFGFALQVLDIDRLSIDLNQKMPNGNLIKMGVEVTPYGRPVAYWLLVNHPGDNYYVFSGSAYERVPAEEVYHLFLFDRPEQTRGVPWMHSAMLRLQNLGGYEEAAIINARIGASKMGFFTTPDGNGDALADGEDPYGGLSTEAEPGQFDVLPEGTGFQSFNPDYPHNMYGDFVKACLRGVASGLGVAYNTLSNDLENVNFSSIRSGTLEERDNWMVLQNWFAESMLKDLYAEWLKYALLYQVVVTPEGETLSSKRFSELNQVSWQGRRWQWVDPRADMEANINAINNNLKSRTDVIAEQGKDISDVWSQIQAENEEAKAKGILFPLQDSGKGNLKPAQIEQSQ